MTQKTADLSVVQRLGQLLDRGLLPAGGPAEAAERLIERLERPARIALLGLPGAGKSSVLNLLCGAVIVPETLRLPTVIVQHRQDERMVCTLADGRTETVAGRDLTKVLTLNPALVSLEIDLPALKVISLLEVSAGPMEAEQRRAALWASKRADILIWCTTSYLPKEQQVWEGMPDAVKDNGFLFLTKTDLLGSKEAARGLLDRVEHRAGEEFRQVLPLSAKEARAALQAPGGVNAEAFRQSGAGAIISTIKSRVQMARRADLDMAELLLARHEETAELVTRRLAEPDQPAAEPEWRAPPEPVPPAAAPVTREAAPAAATPQEPPAATEPVSQRPAPAPDAAPRRFDPPAARQEPTRPVPQQPTPVVEPASLTAPSRSPDPGGERKRFADRIKSMPPPSDAAASPVPLRTTWKSKAETAAPEAVAQPAAPVRPPQPAVAPGPEPEPDLTAAEEASDWAAGVDATPATEVEAEAEPEAPEEERIAAMLAAVARAPVAEPLPRAERPMPTDAAPMTERSAKTSLFGARREAGAPPVAAAPPAARPGAGARPGEPIARVRAPAPRPAEPPRPDTPSPQELASPRPLPGSDRRIEGDSPMHRAERRERPRIAARTVAPSGEPSSAAPQVTASDHELIQAGIDLIVARSTALADEISQQDKPQVDLILDHVRQTVERVIERLGRATSADLRRINSDLGEVLDLVMLMQLEKGNAPADDALTLLLQIRRDLETLNAA